MELELKTGRTHQIRVHLSHMGFPIVGDDLYGGHHSTAAMIDPGVTGERGKAVVMGRQALHAAMLTFVHPVTEKKMTFSAPVRSDMAELLGMLRGRGDAGEVMSVPGAVLDLGMVVPS